MFRIEYYGFGVWIKCGTIAHTKENAIKQAQENSAGGWLKTRIVDLNNGNSYIITKGI
jgi:hypothetical protein